jgi:hypothetical protein
MYRLFFNYDISRLYPSIGINLILVPGNYSVNIFLLYLDISFGLIQ